jgi:hypothetical protein
MVPLEQLDSFRWPTMDFALATLGVRVDDLARRRGFRVEAWEEDGLGPARGAALRLPSGRPVVLQELQFAVDAGTASGPALLVDAADLGAVGVGPLVGEVLAALDLGPDALAWLQEPEAAAEAAARGRWALAYRAARERGEPPPEFPFVGPPDGAPEA